MTVTRSKRELNMPILDEKFLGRELLKAAVMRQIFCPYSGKVLDIRDAVLIDGTDHGHSMYVMTSVCFDLAGEALFEKFGRDNFVVYDGRVLNGRKS
jgi:hypothetical protein